MGGHVLSQSPILAASVGAQASRHMIGLTEVTTHSNFMISLTALSVPAMLDNLLP